MGKLTALGIVVRYIATWVQQPQTVARLDKKVDNLDKKVDGLETNHLSHLAEKLDKIKTDHLSYLGEKLDKIKETQDQQIGMCKATREMFAEQLRKRGAPKTNGPP